MLVVLTTKKQSQHTSFRKSIPGMWKASPLQSFLQIGPECQELPQGAQFYEIVTFYCFLSYVISCPCRLFCYSSNQKLRILS